MLGRLTVIILGLMFVTGSRGSDDEVTKSPNDSKTTGSRVEDLISEKCYKYGNAVVLDRATKFLQSWFDIISYEIFYPKELNEQVINEFCVDHGPLILGLSKQISKLLNRCLEAEEKYLTEIVQNMIKIFYDQICNDNLQSKEQQREKYEIITGTIYGLLYTGDIEKCFLQSKFVKALNQSDYKNLIWTESNFCIDIAAMRDCITDSIKNTSQQNEAEKIVEIFNPISKKILKLCEDRKQQAQQSS